ncbi:MAG: carbohydrate kinase [Candidatus Symbiothrix sp.]|jgi:fructokinase|nr:carbohydrate kinase [Candidatus Symbiothrix sp.]
MRKVIGIGETILDLIFQENQPQKAVPGGSTFNCMISLARCGLEALFVSELGNDHLGEIIRDFMLENGLSADYVEFYDAGKSPIALAFLDKNSQATYSFYREFPDNRLSVAFPDVHVDDVVIFGSYFAVNPEIREKVKGWLNEAKNRQAVIYYDINFRAAHADEKPELMPAFLENIACSTVVRCSDEDLSVLFPNQSIAEIYRTQMAPRCKLLIVTQGANGTLLFTPNLEKSYPVQPVKPVSTIGAGDNFNAGFIHALVQNGITRTNFDNLQEKGWDELIASAHKFAAEVCQSLDNYIAVTSYQ